MVAQFGLLTRIHWMAIFPVGSVKCYPHCKQLAFHRGWGGGRGDKHWPALGSNADLTFSICDTGISVPLDWMG